MARLRSAMDASFWDLDLSTPLTLDGVAKAVPGDPIPLDGGRASKLLRIQQVSLIGNGFPLGIVPSFSPCPNHKEVGSFGLQSLLGKADFGRWWVGIVGQFRPRKLISSIKADVTNAEEWELPLVKDVAKRFVDKSLYAIGLCSQFALTSNTSLLLNTEKHGWRKKPRTKAMLSHKLPDHDINVEAAWPQLFVDHKGKYWEVPESISLDCSSLVSESGFRYRFGIHKTNDLPESIEPTNAEPPFSLSPGVHAKAAFSYEKSKYLWRQEETEEDKVDETEKDYYLRTSYDIRLKEPHSAISGIIGATCGAWFGSRKGSVAVEQQDAGNGTTGSKNRVHLGADLFGSACYTFQRGKFIQPFGDLTRVDARLDIGSASALAKKLSGAFKGSQTDATVNELSSPRLNLIFQQQIAGPIVFRLDSKFSLDSSSGRSRPQLEDIIYSLNYSLRLLGSGKVVAWYSGKRKEGMIELRVFDF